MNLDLEWINRVALDWWSYIVHTSWQGALVGLALLVLAQVVGRRWPAPLRYALLVLALLKFACPPLLPVPTGVFSQFASNKVAWTAGEERKPAQATQSRKAAVGSPDGTGGLAFSPGGGKAKPEAALLSGIRSAHWTAWLMVLHGAGILFMASVIIFQLQRLRRLARNSRFLRGGAAYRDLSINLGLYRIPVLATSDEVDGPIAFGVRRSRILVPTQLVRGLSPGEMNAVLAHELAHCQRGDLWLNWLQLILLSVWWFHPMVWLLHWALREAREDCCDDLLLCRGVVENDAYCDVLLRAASHAHSPAVPLSAALGLGSTIHPLARRLARVTDWTLRRSERVSAGGAIAVLICAALFLPGLKPKETNPTRAGERKVNAPVVGFSLAAPIVAQAKEPASISLHAKDDRGAAGARPARPKIVRPPRVSTTPGPAVVQAKMEASPKASVAQSRPAAAQNAGRFAGPRSPLPTYSAPVSLGAPGPNVFWTGQQSRFGPQRMVRVIWANPRSPHGR